jgi:hypothetical protein
VDYLTSGLVTLGVFVVTQFAYLIWQLARLTQTVAQHSLQLEKIERQDIPITLATLKEQYQSHREQTAEMREQLVRIEHKLDELRKN